MPEITLTPEQTQIVAGVNESILVRDAAGRYIGSLQPSRFTPEEIEEAIRNFDKAKPGFTTAQVLSRLQMLSKAEKQKGSRLDSTEVAAILNNPC